MEEAEWPPSRRIPPPGGTPSCHASVRCIPTCTLPRAHRGRLPISAGPPAARFLLACLPFYCNTISYLLCDLLPSSSMCVHSRSTSAPNPGRRAGEHRDAAAPFLPAWRMSCPLCKYPRLGPQERQPRGCRPADWSSRNPCSVHCAGCCPHSKEPGPYFPRAFVYTVTVQQDQR